ncbi:hypothetical protein JM654_15445 [Microbacterium oxydans]|nr:hypothetical protein [Microbacterium oxydans]
MPIRSSRTRCATWPRLTASSSHHLRSHRVTIAPLDNAVAIDYGLIEDHVREGYDLIEWKGRTYVFT